MKLCLRCNQYFEDGIELCPIDTSTLEAVGEHPLIGALINDRYVVDSVIGKGSSGIVYKATRLLMGREVAVKVLHSYLGAEVGALDRFLREARAASRLRHPHIINIWESGVTDDAQPYFVMDYLEGLTLADLIKQKGFLHAGRAMPIITQICEALGEAHRQNIIHRDIKPENIVLETNEGDNNFDDYVKVLDFGIADAPAGTPGAPKQRTAAGSPAYMSPEQCQGFELDQRSDIYSLAVVIFEMLTGLRPFAADDVMKLFYMHVSQPPPTLSSMRADLRFPMQVELAVAKALAKNPDNRQQTIKEFHKELEDAFASADMGGGRKESVTVDLFSVPESDRLMGGGGAITTGSHNFLPGPEDWIEEQESEEVIEAPAQHVQPPAAKSEAPDVSAAVNRLLKSAKRASEAVKQEDTAKQEDVGSWARDVLTKKEEQSEVKKEVPKPVKESGGQSPPENSGPEISNWAHKVLNRQNTGDMAKPQGAAASAGALKAPQAPAARTGGNNLSGPGNNNQPGNNNNPPGNNNNPPGNNNNPPGNNNNPPLKAPSAMPSSSASTSAPATAGPSRTTLGVGSEAPTTQTKQGGKVVKPIELLKAKNAADAARRPSGELSTPAEVTPPVVQKPASAVPTPNKTLSLKPAEQAALMSKGSEKSPAPNTVAKSEAPSDFGADLGSMLDDMLGETSSSTQASPVSPGTVAPAPPLKAPGGMPGKTAPGQPIGSAKGAPPKAAPGLQPAGSTGGAPGKDTPPAPKPLPAGENKPVQSQSKMTPPTAPGRPASAPASSQSKIASASQPPKPIAPLPSPAASSAPSPFSPTPVTPPAPSTSQNRMERLDETSSSEKPPLDLSRFDQPVNKTTESLNPFAQAIDGLLDAAIMPKTQEDVRRSANKLKKMDAPEGEPDPLDPDRFELPINSRASFDPARFDQPVNRGELAEPPKSENKGFISGTTAGSKMLGASDAEKASQSTSIDMNRFERPINQAEESLNPFAQAIDGLLDSARIKPEPKPIAASPTDLGQTAAAVGKPPDAAAIEALDTTAEEDRVHDAVSRLIEAAKRSPEPVAKPEVLNKKIEAVKKKIEALKAADVAKPISSGLPPDATPSQVNANAASTTNPPAPFVPGPSDSNSLSDAVNRLLEAAQRQETSTSIPQVPPQMVNPFADAYSSPAPPSNFGTSSQTNVPVSNPFDAGASTAMVNPFAAKPPAAQDPIVSGTFKQQPSPNAPTGPAPPDPSKKPPEGSAFQNYVGAQNDRMSRAAELINNAIKSSKTPEVAQDYYSGYKSDPKQIQAERAESIKKGRARVRRNFQGPPKPPLWLAAIFALVVGGFAAWYFGLLPFGPPKAPPVLSLDAYIKQGKFDKAREILEAKKKAGTLSPAESEKLNNVYYQLGLKEGKDENYQDAVKDLKLIPRKSDLYPSAAAKIREYKKKMNDL